MRLRLSDPSLVPDLLEYLESVPDVVADVVSDNEVEVSLMGSYALDAMRMELALRIRAWQAARGSQESVVELVDDVRS
ncbi:MAG: hypothetical protein E6I84_15765 [Chloroflexi bacterium]|nr:MAG: hypothetical protein E6I84_15765 [Chloroflexota bacterium]